MFRFAAGNSGALSSFIGTESSLPIRTRERNMSPTQPIQQTDMLIMRLPLCCPRRSLSVLDLSVVENKPEHSRVSLPYCGGVESGQHQVCSQLLNCHSSLPAPIVATFYLCYATITSEPLENLHGALIQGNLKLEYVFPWTMPAHQARPMYICDVTFTWPPVPFHDVSTLALHQRTEQL